MFFPARDGQFDPDVVQTICGEEESFCHPDTGGDGRFHNLTSVDWIRNEYRKNNKVKNKWRKFGFECVQEPGEMMYVPDAMPHMVLNLGETVAIVGEWCGGKDQTVMAACREPWVTIT